MNHLSPHFRPTRGGRHGNRQRGAVIIIVLWTAALLTILVTVTAGNVRLSAKTAQHNQEMIFRWAELMGAVRHVEMELMLERMPQPIGEEIPTTADGESRNPRYRFNGDPLSLYYPIEDDIVVRAYDHSGKINLNRISRIFMQRIIEKLLGEGDPEDADEDEVQELLAAWTDWTDLNDLEGLNGAEREYYEDLEEPYVPRNSPTLDSVHEILLIRGFDELLKDVHIDAAFTIYGNDRAVNLNLATREAMQLLPGLDEEMIENILALRTYKDINDTADIGEIVPFEDLQELQPWISTQTSDIYSVFVYLKTERDDYQQLLQEDPFANPDPVTMAHMEIIEVHSFGDVPRVYLVAPFGRLPDTAPPRVEEADYLFTVPRN